VLPNKISRIKDWKVYIQRRNSLYYVSVFNKAYGQLLQKEISCSFKNQLYSFGNKICTFYRSEKEIKKVSKKFLNLLWHKKEKIKKIKEKCVKYEQIEKELLKQYENNIILRVENYEKLMEKISHIFLYLTTIPFLALEAISSLSEKEQCLFKEDISFFIKFRKKNRNPIESVIFEQIWKKAAKIQNKPDFIFYSYFTYDELGDLLKNRKYPSEKEIEKRKSGCIFYDSNDKICFYYGSVDQLSWMMPENKKVEKNKYISNIKGNIAYKGYAEGKVCIINHESDLKKFRAGDIIVSINTNPTLMPALVKCKAIITDEGGLSCHASIISRELKKPCIVGTKIATKVLKDGDFVEVNADSGIVKIIK